MLYADFSIEQIKFDMCLSIGGAFAKGRKIWGKKGKIFAPAKSYKVKNMQTDTGRREIIGKGRRKYRLFKEKGTIDLRL